MRELIMDACFIAGALFLLVLSTGCAHVASSAFN